MFDPVNELGTLVFDLSNDLFILKKGFDSMKVFTLLPETELDNTINIFKNSPYSMVPSQMFPEGHTKKAAADEAVETLSYDIIAIVVASRRVEDYFTNTLNNFETGITQI